LSNGKTDFSPRRQDAKKSLEQQTVNENAIAKEVVDAALAPVRKKQLLTYLKLADKRLGLPINFNTPLIKDGITRIANGIEDR
jgi:hypothetical protein